VGWCGGISINGGLNGFEGLVFNFGNGEGLKLVLTGVDDVRCNQIGGREVGVGVFLSGIMCYNLFYVFWLIFGLVPVWIMLGLVFWVIGNVFWV